MIWDAFFWVTATPSPAPSAPESMPFDPAVLAAWGTLVTALGTAIALTIGAFAKYREGVSLRNKKRDEDLIEERKQLVLENEHWEDQWDKGETNRRRLEEHIAAARYRATEKFGPDAAGEIFGDMPALLERTYTKDEVSQMTGPTKTA